MYPNAHHSRGRSGEADAYWQRRFFTLVAGLGVVGPLAWACSGVVSGKPVSHTTGTGASGQAPAAAYGSASPGQAASGQAAAGAAGAGRASAAAPAPGVSRSASPSGSPARMGGSSSRPAVSGTTRPAAASGTGGTRPGKPAAADAACPATDIVLTLLASKVSYGPHEHPAFQIDVVSTDTSACVFDTSPGSLRVVVSHGGQVAWNSGACLHDVAARVTRLRRGVPVVVPVAWNRRLTVSGCPGTVMAASQRTYMAAAHIGGVESPSQSFRLKLPAWLWLPGSGCPAPGGRAVSRPSRTAARDAQRGLSRREPR